MLDDLVGMFAFAILDQRNNKLFLARDRFGEKPLDDAQLADGAVVFASELKALRNMPGLCGTWMSPQSRNTLRWAISPLRELI